MRDKRFELENAFEIWDNKHGSKIVLSKDRDGLGLNEIRAYSEDGKDYTTITLTDEQLNLLGEAIDRKKTLERDLYV